MNLTGRGEENLGINPKIKVFHVGGRGGMGPVENLFSLGKDLSLTIFEANIGSDISWKEYDEVVSDYANRYGARVSVVPACLSNRVGSREFHINVMPDCSSLLSMNPDASNFSRVDRSQYRIVWGQICQPTRTIKIDVTTLDKLYSDGKIELPHVLSLDVQGAEYEIFEGASQALQGDLLGVISEVEFRALYQGQKLFMDQYDFLEKHQFSLFELYNSEYWYSGPIMGKGALTVGEALFLRDYKHFMKKYDKPVPLTSIMSKLAAVAYSFDRKSYAFEIMDCIMNNWQSEWNSLVKNSGDGYLHILDNFYREIRTAPPEAEKLPTYSEFIKKGSNNPQTREPEPKRRSISDLVLDLNLRVILSKLRRSTFTKRKT